MNLLYKQYIKITKIFIKYYQEHTFYVGFLFGMLSLSLIVFFWFRSKILLILIPLAVLLALIILKIKTYFYFKSVSTKILKKDHVAIIFVRYGWLKDISYTFTKERKITSILESSEIPAANYIIKTEKDLEQVLQNKFVKAVIILGHGKRHLLRLRKGIYFYCDFLDKPTNIKYVAQLHCNDGVGKSLYELIKCKGFDTSDLTHTSDIDNFISSKTFIDSLKEALS